LIDNFKPGTGGGEAALVGLIHNIVEGGEKSRLNRAADLRESRPIDSFALITGESFPMHDAAATARTLVVYFPEREKTAPVPDALKRAQADAEHLCAVGAAWITWLESDDGQRTIDDVGRDWDEAHNRWREYIHAKCPGVENPDRVATNLATNDLVWRVAERHPHIGRIIQEHCAAHEQGLAAVAATMATGTASGLEARRYMDILRGLLASGERSLQGVNDSGEPPRGMIGWEDGRGVYLIPDLARKAVLTVDENAINNISATDLYRQFKSLGWLAAVASDGRALVSKKIHGKNHRVLHFDASVLSADDEQDEGPPF
jgi:hypothetical protein